MPSATLVIYYAPAMPGSATAASAPMSVSFRPLFMIFSRRLVLAQNYRRVVVRTISRPLTTSSEAAHLRFDRQRLRPYALGLFKRGKS
jgi:hypothetical protein